MDLHQLRSFYEIVREQSFTRAADKLFLTQPAISLQIKALENELDELLLERNRRQLRLTPAGEILFAHAKAVLARLEQAHDDIAALKQVLRGRLAIGTSDTNCTYVLPNVLAEFRARYPAVELDIRNRMSPEVSNLVLNDEVEFGLATLPVKHRDLVSESLFERRDVLICPPDHALGKRRRIRLKQLAEYPFLVLERGSTSRQLLDEVFSTAGLGVAGRNESRRDRDYQALRGDRVGYCAGAGGGGGSRSRRREGTRYTGQWIGQTPNRPNRAPAATAFPSYRGFLGALAEICRRRENLTRKLGV